MYILHISLIYRKVNAIHKDEKKAKEKREDAAREVEPRANSQDLFHDGSRRCGFQEQQN